MPRIERGLGDNIVYHVINRGNGRQEIFHKDKDYETFVQLLQEAKERYEVRLYGYCLMPTCETGEFGSAVEMVFSWRGDKEKSEETA